MQKILLIPGLPGVDAFLEYAIHRYGNLEHGLKRLRDEVSRRIGALREETAPDDIATTIRIEHEIIAHRVSPTLCLMNALHGKYYVGEFEDQMQWHPSILLPFIFLSLKPDAYTLDEVSFDWASVLKDWKNENPSTASKPPVKKTKAQKHAERAEAAKKKIASIRTQLTAAKKDLTSRKAKDRMKEKIKAQKAALRQALAAQKIAEKEEARHAKQEKALAAKIKARQTVVLHRDQKLRKAARKTQKLEASKQEVMQRRIVSPPMSREDLEKIRQARIDERKKREEKARADRLRENEIKRAERAFRKKYRFETGKPEPK